MYCEILIPIRNSEKTHYPACAGCKKPLRLIFALLCEFSWGNAFFPGPLCHHIKTSADPFDFALLGRAMYNVPNLFVIKSGLGLQL